jgi:uncharacterized protein (TIGR02147 family)
MKGTHDFNQIDFLRKALGTRLTVNSRYSMRAFANLLKINIGTLSGLLSGNRKLSESTAGLLCDRLGISPKEKAKILDRVRQPKKEAPQATNISARKMFDRLELDEEYFRVISEWYHYGILQLVRTKSYLENVKNSQPKWFARQLKITEIEAKLALDRLLNLNLLTKDENNFLKRTNRPITTANKNMTSCALKKLQKQIREKAIYSLEHDPLEVRSMTSITMAISLEKLQTAKKLIDEFQEKLAEFLESDQKEEVYQLEISLFPIQIKEN